MPSTEEVKARLLIEQLQDNANVIRPLLNPPVEMSPHNVQIMRAVYVSKGVVVAAAIHTMQGRNPHVEVQRAWSDDGNSHIQFVDLPSKSAIDAAVFLGLDSCYPRIPVWTAESLSESGLVVVKSGLNGNSAL